MNRRIVAVSIFGGVGDLKPENARRILDLVVLPNPAVGFQAAPPRRFHPSWMFCSVLNDSDEALFVYGARHQSETTTIPTSLFLLPPRSRSPLFWDCKGILIPLGREARIQGETIHGPVALKYRDLRWIRIRFSGGVHYCPRPNGVLSHGQVEFPAPQLTYSELLACPRRAVHVR